MHASLLLPVLACVSAVRAGDTVTLAPERPAGDGLWIQLSGPAAALRPKGSRGAELRLRLSAPGEYLLCFLPDGTRSIARGELHELSAEPRPGAPPRPVARISGRRLVGADEEPVLKVEAGLPGGDERLDIKSVRWRRLWGPECELFQNERDPRRIRTRPRSAGRYVFGARAVTERGATREAVFAFELPARSDGAPDRRPLARVRPPGRLYAGRSFVLDGSGSLDPDGDELRYEWERLSGPPGRTPEAPGASFRFMPAVPGEYVFSLVVSDPFGLESPPEVVTAEVRALPELPAAAPGACGPLDRPVTLRLEGGTLGSLLGKLARASVNVRISSRVLDSRKFDEVKLDMWAVDLPARKVLDWLGRILGAYYVVEREDAVWFDRGTRPLEREELSPGTYRVDGLFLREDASDLLGLLRECLRSCLWAGRSCTLGPVDTKKGRLQAILPESGSKLLGRVLRELRRPVPSGPPPAGEDLALRRVLVRQVSGSYRARPLREVAWDLAFQVRVPIGFDPALGARPVSFSLERKPLREALSRLVEAAGLSGYLLEMPGAIWLYEGPRPLSSAESPWTSFEVRSYEMKGLERRGFSGPVVIRLVKGRVRAETWTDPPYGPFAAVCYSAARRRLLVLHHPDVQSEVGGLLRRLALEGEGALEAGK